MNFLITGAQFSNKGAQSMLFSIVSELRNKYEDAGIYYLASDGINYSNKKNYKLIYVIDDLYWTDFRDDMKDEVLYFGKAHLSRLKHSLIHDDSNVVLLSRAIKLIDVLVDVSGFQLSSKFDNRLNFRFLRYIQYAKKRNITVILMPQSFGPFDYVKSSEKINKEIKKQLSQVDLIFAREEEGKKLLHDKYGITDNVFLSTDLVLQSGRVDKQNIYNTDIKDNYIKLNTTGNVGIIPNMQTLVHGNDYEVKSAYKKIIDKLLQSKKEVYIFRHSNDLPICRSIYEMYPDNEHVHLIEDEMDCFEYSLFIRQFDFVVASRFHAIVHAYKENVPAIILGWAIKYLDLAKHLGQERYVLDITTSIDYNKIEDLVNQMLSNYTNEKSVIKRALESIQKETCLQKCWSVISHKDDIRQ